MEEDNKETYTIIYNLFKIVQSVWIYNSSIKNL